MISFRFTCSFTALLCLILFAVFLVAPGAYSAGYGVAPDAGGLFLGNRAAPLFLGFAAICWLLRTTPHRDVRRAVSVAMILSFAGIALTGIWAYLQGQASGTILLAAAGECVLAGAFALSLRDRA